MIVYGHMIHRAYPESLALGIGGVFWNPDDNGTPASEEFVAHLRANPHLRFVCGFWFTEERLVNWRGVWERDVRNALNWFKEQGVLEQCALIQYDDEWWTGLWADRFTENEYWPSLQGLSQAERWARRFTVAADFGRRTDDLRSIWQDIAQRPLPLVGMAETGAVAPPEFRGQGYWGLNVYYAPWGAYYYTPRAVQRVYEAAWAFTRLPLMPVLGIFEDQPNAHLPTLQQLAAVYAPIVFHPRTFAVGIFALHHPGQYAPSADGYRARGVLDMDPSYGEGVRWLTQALSAR